MTIGSTSKSFWGGLRIGWIRAERSTLATIAALRPSIDMGTPIVEQLAAARLLGEAEDVLPERREILRERRALLLSLLDEHLPDWRPVPGNGGMALWVRLPAPMSSALSAAASRMGLEIPPGPRFGVDGTLERFIRVPYTLPDDQLARGDRIACPRMAFRHRRDGTRTARDGRLARGHDSVTLSPAGALSSSRAGLGWGLLGVVAFSFTVIFTRVAVGGLSPLFVGSARAVIAALLAAAALALTQQHLPTGDPMGTAGRRRGR